MLKSFLMAAAALAASSGPHGREVPTYHLRPAVARPKPKAPRVETRVVEYIPRGRGPERREALVKIVRRKNPFRGIVGYDPKRHPRHVHVIESVRFL